MDKRIRGAALAAVAWLWVGCAGQAESYVDALPDADGLMLEVTGDASELAQKASADGVTVSAVDNVPEAVALARDGVRRVNATVRALMERVQAFKDANAPVEIAEGVHRYGPADEDGVTYRLFVRRLEEDAFGWRLEAKPVGAADDVYVRVLGGAVRRPEENLRRGVLGVNLDHLASVKDGFAGQGVLLAGFAVREQGKTLSYRLNQFTPDVAAHPPLTAMFVGHRRFDTGASAVRLSTRRDFDAIPDGTQLPEWVRIRARWTPDVGGHAGLLVTHGDVPQGEAYLGRACWNAQLEEGFRSLRHCTGMQQGSPPACEVIAVAGTPAACPVEPREPGMDPMDGAHEEGAPDADVVAPLVEPTGDTLP